MGCRRAKPVVYFLPEAGGTQIAFDDFVESFFFRTVFSGNAAVYAWTIGDVIVDRHGKWKRLGGKESDFGSQFRYARFWVIYILVI